jgi:type VI protein secretion system component Hcp
MYKNFTLTESEKEEILNRLKENGYGQPINEQQQSLYQPGDVSVARVQSNSSNLFLAKTVTLYSSQYDANRAYSTGKSLADSKGSIVCKITQIRSANNDGVTFQAVPINEKLGHETSRAGLSWKQTDDVAYGGFQDSTESRPGGSQWITFMYVKNDQSFKILDSSTDQILTIMSQNDNNAEAQVTNRKMPQDVTSIPYYNYSLRDAIVKEFYNTDYASNDKQHTPTDQIAEGKQILIDTFKKLIK